MKRGRLLDLFSNNNNNNNNNNSANFIHHAEHSNSANNTPAPFIRCLNGSFPPMNCPSCPEELSTFF